jgi:PAS domain S-box-containing protein
MPVGSVMIPTEDKNRQGGRVGGTAALSKDELLARLNEAQRNAHIGSWSWDLRTGDVWWSDELYRIFELDPATFTPSVSANAAYVHPEDRDAYHEAVARVLSEGGLLDYELRVVAASGVKHCRSRGQVELDAGGTPIRLYGTFHDVTQSRLAKLTLQASEQRFRLLAESFPALVWTCSADGVCDYVNRRWREYAGDAGVVDDATWWRLVHAEDRARVLADWSAALAQAQEFHCDLRLRRRDGTYRWFETRATRSETGGADPVRWIGSAIDIDDRRRAQELQLRTQKMEALGTLAGGIAHDFNNILLAISGNARLALADLSESHPARASVVEIGRAGARAADLVRRILMFSRQEDPKREVIDLKSVTEEALKLLRPTLPAMIELRAQLASDAPNVIADATQVHQVLMNLCANAAHAIGAEAGVIEVRLEAVHRDAELARTVPSLAADSYVRLSVSDTGCGMTGATLARIFDPFFTTKPVGEGTGMGLSVVAGIVQGHGGAITARSSPGAGSTFDVYFPACSSGTKPITRAALHSRRGRGERVMYVDDDEALVRLASRTLERMGYRVHGFVDPDAALDWYTENASEVDVAVTDLSMPRMSGFDLARALLALRADLPIVVTSGFIRKEDQQAAASIGVRALILKPDTIDELSRMLHDLLRPSSSPE